MPSRWMLYSYDALGLGHVRRLLAIVRAVLSRRADLDVLLATCSPQIQALPIPDGLDYIKLPSARKINNNSYVSRTLRLDDERFRALRSELLLSLIGRYEPDLLLVDKSPTGLMGELGPALDLIRSRANGERLVLGWRDILDGPEQVRHEWRDGEALRTMERLYDEIWVYGDPSVFDVRDAYAIPDRLAERVRYIGYLAPPQDPARRERSRADLELNGSRLAVVTAGGGEDGEAVLSCYLDAARRGLLPDSVRSIVVTGPFLPREAQQRLRAESPAGVTITEFIPGLDGLIAAADAVVGMAGYNTVCEVLGAGTPAVLVPRNGHREEQRIRASRLASLGVAEQLTLEALNPRSLADAVGRALARERGTPPAVPLDGLARVAGEIERILPRVADSGGARDSADGALLEEPSS